MSYVKQSNAIIGKYDFCIYSEKRFSKNIKIAPCGILHGLIASLPLK
jgi:hypothetical protein